MDPRWKRQTFLIMRRVVSLLSIFLPLLPALAKSAKSLFDDSPHVVELNPDSMEKVTKSSCPWVIMAYSPSCPHCQKYSPKWEEMGKLLDECTTHVGAVNCVKHRALCGSLEARRYPSLLAINWPGALPPVDGNPAIKNIASQNTPDGLVQAVHQIFDLPEEGITCNETCVVKEQRELGTRNFDREGATYAKPKADKRCEDRLQQAVNSIRFLFLNDIFTGGMTLHDERIDALESFLELLGANFPGRENRASFLELAVELRRNIELKTFRGWDERQSRLWIGHYSPPGNMAEFLISQSKHFTPGLWSMLHALSVSQAPHRKSPYEVMTGIRDFVADFFRCEHCRQHFLEMYDQDENGRSEIRRDVAEGSQSTHHDMLLAIWLWRTHNAVNVRLVKESNEKLEESKRTDPAESLWPDRRICPGCWNGYSSSPGEPSWSEADVFEFISDNYWCIEGSEDAEDQFVLGWIIRWGTLGLAAAFMALLALWTRKWSQLRGIGLSKRRADTLLDP